MNQGLIPGRYAKALYKFALDNNATERVYQLMQKLTAAFAAEPRLREAVANPFVSADDKTKLLMAAAGADANTDTCFADFIALLIANHRIEFTRETALAYMALYRKANNIRRVSVVSAAKLDPADVSRLRKVISDRLAGATMEFESSVDPALIGGFVVNIDDERLDASVSNELKQLRLKLLSN